MNWVQVVEWPNSEDWWEALAETPEGHVLKVYGHYFDGGGEFQVSISMHSGSMHSGRYALGHTPHDNPEQSKEWAESMYAKVLQEKVNFVGLKPLR